MIQFIIFLLLSIGLLLVFNINIKPKDIQIKRPQKAKNKKESLKSHIEKTEGKTKQNIFEKANAEAKKSLIAIDKGNRFKTIKLLAFFIAIFGGGVGLLLHNIFLAAVLAVGCYFLPLWLVKLSVYKYTRETNDELGISLSAVTTSYMRTNDFQTAVKENIQYMNGKVYKAFNGFLAAMAINPSINYALNTLKNDIDCPLYISWVDTIILCQDDHTLKYALPTIIAKFSTLKKLQMENETRMTMPLKYATIIVIMSALFIPMITLLNAEWYTYMSTTIPGQILIALVAIADLFTINKAIKLSGPIEYAI